MAQSWNARVYTRTYDEVYDKTKFNYKSTNELMDWHSNTERYIDKLQTEAANDKGKAPDWLISKLTARLIGIRDHIHDRFREEYEAVGPREFWRKFPFLENVPVFIPDGIERPMAMAAAPIRAIKKEREVIDLTMETDDANSAKAQLDNDGAPSLPVLMIDEATQTDDQDATQELPGSPPLLDHPDDADYVLPSYDLRPRKRRKLN